MAILTTARKHSRIITATCEEKSLPDPDNFTAKTTVMFQNQKRQQRTDFHSIADLKEESSSSKRDLERNTPRDKISNDGMPSVLINNSYEFEPIKRKKRQSPKKLN